MSARLGPPPVNSPRQVALVVGAVLFSADPVLAFRCMRTGVGVGPSLVWPERQVPWWLDSSVIRLELVRAREEAEGAFLAWSQPECTDLELPLEGVADGLASEFVEGAVNRNVVLLQTRWSYAPTALAITVSFFETATGRLLDADIELNGEVFDFRVVDPGTCVEEDGIMDLRNTLTHEVGHLVGLDHPPSSSRYRETTMFARAPPCETIKRTLESDDIDGVCAIYPSGQPTRPCFPPEESGFRVVEVDDGYGGCSAGHPSVDPSPARWPLLPVGLLVVALFFARTRRRRDRLR